MHTMQTSNHIWLTPWSWDSKCDIRVKISKWLNSKSSKSNMCFRYFKYHRPTSLKKKKKKVILWDWKVVVVCCSAVKAKITMLHGHHYGLVLSTLNILSMICLNTLPLEIHITNYTILNQKQKLGGIKNGGWWVDLFKIMFVFFLYLKFTRDIFIAT